MILKHISDKFSTNNDDRGSGNGKEARKVIVHHPMPKTAHSGPAKSLNQSHAHGMLSSMENILSLDRPQQLTALAEMLSFMLPTILSMCSNIDFLIQAEQAYGWQVLLDKQQHEHQVSHTIVEDDEEELEYIDEVSQLSKKSIGKHCAN